MNKFNTPTEAEDQLASATQSTSQSLSPSSVLQECKNFLMQLNSQEHLHVVSILYSEFADSQLEHPSSVPSDFLELAFNAVCHLNACGRSNILYLMAKGLGTMRLD